MDNGNLGGGRSTWRLPKRIDETKLPSCRGKQCKMLSFTDYIAHYVDDPAKECGTTSVKLSTWSQNGPLIFGPGALGPYARLGRCLHPRVKMCKTALQIAPP